MPSATKVWTAEELLYLPEDNKRHELVRGKLRTYPLKGFLRGIIACKLGAELRSFADENQLGIVTASCGFLIESDPDSVLAPDVSFVCRRRIDVIGIPEGYFPGPPDLAVEVIEATDSEHAVSEKIHHWLITGTKEVWVVRMEEKSITVYREDNIVIDLSENDTLDGGDLIPGFTMPIRDLFAH